MRRTVGCVKSALFRREHTTGRGADSVNWPSASLPRRWLYDAPSLPQGPRDRSGRLSHPRRGALFLCGRAAEEPSRPAQRAGSGTGLAPWRAQPNAL